MGDTDLLPQLAAMVWICADKHLQYTAMHKALYYLMYSDKVYFG